jgi:hypothetical protein
MMMMIVQLWKRKSVLTIESTSFESAGKCPRSLNCFVLWGRSSILQVPTIFSKNYGEQIELKKKLSHKNKRVTKRNSKNDWVLLQWSEVISKRVVLSNASEKGRGCLLTWPNAAISFKNWAQSRSTVLTFVEEIKSSWCLRRRSTTWSERIGKGTELAVAMNAVAAFALSSVSIWKLLVKQAVTRGSSPSQTWMKRCKCSSVSVRWLSWTGFWKITSVLSWRSIDN